MEGISANVYKGIRSYWKRRGYKKLNKNNRNSNVPAEAGQTISDLDPNPVRGRRRRFFRVKINRRMRIWRRVVGMPKKWLIRLRDAYVNMMLNLSNSGFMVAGGATGFGRSVEYGYGSGTCRTQLKEYDEKMIVEIYKSLMIAQGQIGGATKGNAQHVKNTDPDKITISAR